MSHSHSLVWYIDETVV